MAKWEYKTVGVVCKEPMDLGGILKGFWDDRFEVEGVVPSGVDHVLDFVLKRPYESEEPPGASN